MFPIDLDLERLAPACRELVTRLPLAPLGPGQPLTDLRARLGDLTDQDLFGTRPVRDPQMASCCRAALWLAFNFLDASHRLSQEIETRTGSYWHGIMHRREPDFGNSKYWYRRVGRHPIFPALADAARTSLESGAEPGLPEPVRLPTGDWDPFWFVDLCERAYRGTKGLEPACRRIADLEWRLLFDYSYRSAIGEPTD